MQTRAAVVIQFPPAACFRTGLIQSDWVNLATVHERGASVALLAVLHSCGDRRHSKQHVKWGPEGCCGSAMLPVATYSTGLPLSARGMKWVIGDSSCVCGRGGSGVW